MGRPELYHTKEEKAAAAAARSARYYKRNKETICKARKDKYIPKEPRQSGPPAIALTDEEKKVKNRAKSSRHYERNKSKIRKVRQSKAPKRTSWGFLQGASHCYHSVWNEHLCSLNARISDALKGESLPTFVDGVALAYMDTGLRGPLDDATLPFLKIKEELDHHERGVLNEIGAGAHLGDINKVRKYLGHVIDLLEHLILVALEKEDTKGFLEAYESGDLMHHVLYF